ncbi:hypothetical protein HMI56_002845 [Coelomomyces lativittatus]|nr:hypothetical protein HMI56_002845 [Coelomomyces lativittatus]
MSFVNVSLNSFDDKEMLSLTYRVQFRTNANQYPLDQSLSDWADIGQHLKMQMVCPKPITNPFELIILTEINKENSFQFEGVLIVIDLNIVMAETLEKKDTIVKRIFKPGSKWSLGSYNSSKVSTLDFRLKFVLIKTLDFTSNLSYVFSPPSKTPFIGFLNNKTYSDCCLQLKRNDQKIWVNTRILSSQCNFFAKMLQEEWSNVKKNENNAQELIDLSNWSDEVIVGCILHLYAGWLPGTKICDEVIKQLNKKASDLEYNLHTLSELAETAKMIELDVLAFFCLREIKKLADQEMDSIPLDTKQFAIKRGTKY